MEEWGRGSGYRERVADYNDDWFNADNRCQLEDDLHDLIKREWDAALDRVRAIFDPDDA